MVYITFDISIGYPLPCSTVTSLISVMVTSLSMKKSFCIILIMTRFQFGQSRCAQGEPDPGECKVARNPHENDTTEYPSSQGACNFTGSGQAALCSYRQGCRDKDMSNWTAANGTATVHQIGKACGRLECYSILESPWLDFKTESFVQFSFLTVLPYSIDVFFATKDGYIQTITDGQRWNNYRNYVNFTATKSVGKILFRANCGGGTTFSKLELYAISIIQDTLLNPDNDTTNNSIPSTNSVHTTNTSVTLELMVTDIKTESPSVSSSIYKTNSTSTTITSAENHSTDSHTSASGNDGIPVPVIAGVVAAVVVVLALIVIAIIIWRRRRHNKAKPVKNNQNQNGVQNTGNVNIISNDQLNGHSSTQPYSSLTVPQANLVDHYTEVDGFTRPGGHSQDPDGDPYEPAAAVDGEPGITRGKSSDVGQKRVQLNEEVEDTYHEIDDFQSTPQPGKKALPTGVVGVAQNQAQGIQGEVYAVVNKKGVKPATPPKPAQQQQDRTTTRNTTNGQRVLDEYSVLKLGQNGKDWASDEGKHSSNAVYNHLQDAPEDAYSKAEGDKHQVVIDSTYDHMKHKSDM